MQIVVNNLSYFYGKGNKNLSIKALDNVSITINEGDFFGIIGHTGSGKSTFIQHLNGLIKPIKGMGSIVVGDYNLCDKKCDFNQLRSKVGMVFQYPEYQLFAETVYDDVAFGIKNFFPSLTEEQREEMIKNAINSVNLNYEEIKDKSPFELSGGQKRRVAIAGVIVTKPEILVLDEPAAGLDPKGKRDFIQLLHQLKNTFVKTIIIVSHDMNLISENCNKVAVFEKGKCQLLGTPKEVFSNYEIIKRAGLDLPLTAYLTKKLKEKGIEIDSDLTENDFVRAIKQRFGGKK